MANDILNNMDTARHNFETRRAIFEKSEQTLGGIVAGIVERQETEKKAVSARIAQLEEELKESKRETLRRINETLEKDEKARKASASAFWVNYYGGESGAIHEMERKRLEKLKRDIESDLKYEPLTDKEQELSSQRGKTWSLTDNEEYQLIEAHEAYTDNYKAMMNRFDTLETICKQETARLKQIQNLVSPDSRKALENRFAIANGNVARFLKPNENKRDE